MRHALRRAGKPERTQPNDIPLRKPTAAVLPDCFTRFLRAAGSAHSIRATRHCVS